VVLLQATPVRARYWRLQQSSLLSKRERERERACCNASQAHCEAHRAVQRYGTAPTRSFREASKMYYSCRRTGTPLGSAAATHRYVLAEALLHSHLAKDTAFVEMIEHPIRLRRPRCNRTIALAIRTVMLTVLLKELCSEKRYSERAGAYSVCGKKKQPRNRCDTSCTSCGSSQQACHGQLAVEWLRTFIALYSHLEVTSLRRV
jgi:hypothetical protein